MDFIKAAELGLERRAKKAGKALGVLGIIATLTWSLFGPRCELD